MISKLTDEQQQGLEMVQSNKVSILTGAPGVGKTFTLKAVLEWAHLHPRHMKVSLASPTGKAAKQMWKATGHSASTIHRLLEPRMGVNDKFIFQRDERNPLEVDLLVLDEVSMVTNSLMASVMRAINPYKTRLLMVGDHYQLPSIGAGAILRDMIASDIPCTELTLIQRNSGDIVKACHEIKDGKYYNPSKTLDPENGLNLRHIEIQQPERIRRTIQDIVCNRMPARGFDPIRDVQVLSPTNKRTSLSCKGLNEVLQEELNPAPVNEGTIFRENDKVIQIKNDKISTPDGSEVLVVNGDIGTILEIDPMRKKMVVEFDDPERFVFIPLKRNNLLLAYAITVHRFQGSESPVVVIPVHSGFNFFCNRPWIYTAISRAQTICITVGEFSAIKKAVDRETTIHRRTKLREKLQN